MEPASKESIERLIGWAEARGNDELADALRDGDVELWTQPEDRVERLRLLTPELGEALPDWSTIGPPNAAGEFLGETAGDEWRPSLEGAVRLGARNRNGRAVLNEHATQLFLYGRDVLSGSILEHDRRLRKGDVAWVCSPEGDVLGLATVVAGWDSEDAVLRPIMDLGWYLREGG